MKYNKNCEMM